MFSRDHYILQGGSLYGVGFGACMCGLGLRTAFGILCSRTRLDVHR